MAGKAQAGQENFRLILTTGISFTGDTNPSEVAIQYRKGIAGEETQEWEADKTGPPSQGQIFHDFDDEDPVPVKGVYQVRARLVIDGKTVYTQPVEWEVGGW